MGLFTIYSQKIVISAPNTYKFDDTADIPMQLLMVLKLFIRDPPLENGRFDIIKDP